jgi:transposase
MCASNTDTANKETKGYCHYKNVNGIKRHVLVDVLGNVFFVHCTPANISDDQGMVEMLIKTIEFFKTLSKQVTILLDNGYHIANIQKKLKNYPTILEKVVFKLSPKPQRTEANSGFIVIHKRWIVERTNSWFNQCRALWKNCEGLLSTSEVKLKICSIRLILRRLVN